MGALLGKAFWFWTPAGYDKPDPDTGLTPREKDLVQKSWRLVTLNTRENGIKLFIKFFEAHPQYQKLFKGFADVPLSELPNNGKLLGHATAVMYALSSIVDNLSDAQVLVEILKKVAVTHAPRNITPVHFQNLTNIIVGCLTEALGTSVMTEEAQKAWRKSLDAAMGIITKELANEKQKT